MMGVLYHNLTCFSMTKLLISAPIKTIYIQKYTHIIERTIVVKLPYITENPSNAFKYIENTYDIKYQPIVPIIAPGTCFFSFCLCPGTYLYINNNIKNIKKIK